MNQTVAEIQALLGDVELSAPVPDGEIAAFEAKHSIRLPEDYREFLLSVGGHGNGPPEYGLLALGEVKGGHVPDYLKDGYGDLLARPFPLSEAWVWEVEQDSPELATRLESTHQGCLALGHDGCGMYWLLVVSGTCRGEIWQASGEGICPCDPRLTFAQWYLKWLKGDTDWWQDHDSPDGGE